MLVHVPAVCLGRKAGRAANRQCRSYRVCASTELMVDECEGIKLAAAAYTNAAQKAVLLVRRGTGGWHTQGRPRVH